MLVESPNYIILEQRIPPVKNFFYPIRIQSNRLTLKEFLKWKGVPENSHFQALSAQFGEKERGVAKP